MAFFDWFGSAMETVGSFLGDTFGGGSKSSKLSAENQSLQASIEQQKALLASYEGTVQQLTSQVSQLASNGKSYLPWILGGVGVLGAVFVLKRGF